jgi:hypothetical protein
MRALSHAFAAQSTIACLDFARLSHLTAAIRNLASNGKHRSAAPTDVRRYTSLVSWISISTPPLANFGTSAAVAFPSELLKAAWMSARLSKLSVAMR